MSRDPDAAALDPAAVLDTARRVLRIESESVAALAERLDQPFVDAVSRVLDTEGRVVVTGVGKSGAVARKIASTLSSTGTPALFLHPVEGAHGDVGVLIRGDLLIVVSRSGESAELATLLPAVRRLRMPVIAITAVTDSVLGRQADLVLDAGVAQEACPHELSPTSSSTAAMALGDALAMALLQQRGFETEDFARLHPAGALGRRLLLRVDDVMVDAPDRLPGVTEGTTLDEAMRQIANLRGTVPVLDDSRRVIGVVTAGDLTRFAESTEGFMSRPVSEAMNADPAVCRAGSLASEALERLESRGIMAMPVVDGEGILRGMVHLHDVLRAGVR